MSAYWKPVCGRESSEFSTFTASTGRLRRSLEASGSPVRGAMTGAWVVVVTAAVVGGGAVSATGRGDDPPPQPIVMSTAAATASATPFTDETLPLARMWFKHLSRSRRDGGQAGTHQ